MYIQYNILCCVIQNTVTQRGYTQYLSFYDYIVIMLRVRLLINDDR